MKKILLLLSFVSLACFGQLDIVKRTVTLDSLSMRGDTLWLTDGAGDVAWLRVSGDTLYFGDATGENALSVLASGGGNGNVISAVDQDLSTQVDNGIVSIKGDTINTSASLTSFSNGLKFGLGTKGTITSQSPDDLYLNTEDLTLDCDASMSFYASNGGFFLFRNNSGSGTNLFNISANGLITVYDSLRILGGGLNISDALNFSTGATVNKILDEDNMASNDDSALATQQSIKAYVDAQFAGSGITLSDVENNDFNSLTADTLILNGDTVTDLKLKKTRTWDDTLHFEYQNEYITNHNITTDETLVLKVYASQNQSTNTFHVTGTGTGSLTFPSNVRIADADSFINFENVRSRYICYYTEDFGTICRLDDTVTIDGISPYLLTATVQNTNPDSLLLTFSEDITGTEGNGTGGFSITGYGSLTVTNIQINNNTAGLLLSDSVAADSSYTLDYNAGTGDIADLNNNTLKSFSDSSVTNNYISFDESTFNPFLIMDANYSASFTLSGNDITAFTGKSPGDATLTPSANQPDLLNDGTNNYVDFIKANSQTLINNSLASYLTGDDNSYSIALVFKSDDNSAYTHVISGSNSTNDDAYSNLAIEPSPLRYFVTRDDASGGTAAQTQTFGTATTTNRILTMSYTGTAVTVYLDGTKVLDGAAWNSAALTLDLFTIGAWQRTPTIGFFDGRIYYLMMSGDAWTDQQLQDLNDHLNTVYSVY